MALTQYDVLKRRGCLVVVGKKGFPPWGRSESESEWHIFLFFFKGGTFSTWVESPNWSIHLTWGSRCVMFNWGKRWRGAKEASQSRWQYMSCDIISISYPHPQYINTKGVHTHVIIIIACDPWTSIHNFILSGGPNKNAWDSRQPRWLLKCPWLSLLPLLSNELA